MDVSKLKSPPIRAEMKFGPAVDDILVMLLDPDVVTSDFLIEMDSSARRIFKNQLAGVRKVLERRAQLPGPDTKGEPEAKREESGDQPLDADGDVAAQVNEEVQRITAEALRELEDVLPPESESVPLAQAEQLTYMAETCARVIMEWDLTSNGKRIAITEKRELACCAAANSECRHAGAFLRTRSRNLLERLFQFACFEGQAPEKKTR